jgi:hypothetical protein
LNSPSFVYRELAKDIDQPVFIYLGHLSSPNVLVALEMMRLRIRDRRARTGDELCATSYETRTDKPSCRGTGLTL